MAFPCHHQEAGAEVEHRGLEPVPICDATLLKCHPSESSDSCIWFLIDCASRVVLGLWKPICVWAYMYIIIHVTGMNMSALSRWVRRRNQLLEPELASMTYVSPCSSLLTKAQLLWFRVKIYHPLNHVVGKMLWRDDLAHRECPQDKARGTCLRGEHTSNHRTFHKQKYLNFCCLIKKYGLHFLKTSWQKRRILKLVSPLFLWYIRSISHRTFQLRNQQVTFSRTMTGAVLQICFSCLDFLYNCFIFLPCFLKNM